MTDGVGARLAATLVALFAVALLLAFFASIAQIVLLVFIAALLAAYLDALTGFLARHLRTPRLLSLAIAVVVSLVAVGGIGLLVLPPLISQTQELVAGLPRYVQSLEATMRGVADRYGLIGRLAFDREGGFFIEHLIEQSGAFLRSSLVPYLTAGGKVVIELVSVLAMALYFVRNPSQYREGMISLVPPRARHIARMTLKDLSNTFRAWVTGQLMAMVILAVLTAVGLWLLRVPYPLAFGAFTGVLALVPFFGTIVSTLLPALFVVVTGGLGQAFAVLLLGAGVHLLEANVVAPLIFQEKIQLPPALTILSLLIAAKLLGVLGLVVSVPLLATVIVLVRHLLISQVYGDQPRGARTSAVLVPTQEHRFLTLP